MRYILRLSPWPSANCFTTLHSASTLESIGDDIDIVVVGASGRPAGPEESPGTASNTAYMGRSEPGASIFDGAT